MAERAARFFFFGIFVNEKVVNKIKASANYRHINPTLALIRTGAPSLEKGGTPFLIPDSTATKSSVVSLMA